MDRINRGAPDALERAALACIAIESAPIEAGLQWSLQGYQNCGTHQGEGGIAHEGPTAHQGDPGAIAAEHFEPIGQQRRQADQQQQGGDHRRLQTKRPAGQHDQWPMPKIERIGEEANRLGPTLGQQLGGGRSRFGQDQQGRREHGDGQAGPGPFGLRPG